MSTRKHITAPPLYWKADLAPGDVDYLETVANDVCGNLREAAISFIRVGNALNQARQVFKGDKEFGQWREECTPISSGTTATKYMAVARKFSEHGLAEKASYSLLSELTNAKPEVVKAIEKKIDAGENVTVKDARKMKRDTDEETVSPPTASAISNEPQEPVDVEVVDAPPKVDLAARGINHRMDLPEDSHSTSSEEPDLPPGEYEMVTMSVQDIALCIVALRAMDSEESNAAADRLVDR